MYDDKILIFYNTDDNHPMVIKRKDKEELISHLNDIASNGKTATNECPNGTGNNSLIVQNKNSLELSRASTDLTFKEKRYKINKKETRNEKH